MLFRVTKDQALFLAYVITYEDLSKSYFSVTVIEKYFERSTFEKPLPWLSCVVKSL